MGGAGDDGGGGGSGGVLKEEDPKALPKTPWAARRGQGSFAQCRSPHRHRRLLRGWESTPSRAAAAARGGKNIVVIQQRGSNE